VRIKSALRIAMPASSPTLLRSQGMLTEEGVCSHSGKRSRDTTVGTLCAWRHGSPPLRHLHGAEEGQGGGRHGVGGAPR